MSPLAVALLRRLAVLAIFLAVALAAGPPLLRELGLMGPDVEEELASAASALEAAHVYGASEQDSAYQAASRELARARELGHRGKRREARHAAAAARARAVEAQRAALAAREASRRGAQLVVDKVDKLLNELEDVYAEVTPGLEKPTVSRLLSLMKNARQTGGVLYLAYEQGQYDKVIQEEKGAIDALLSVQRELRAARR